MRLRVPVLVLVTALLGAGLAATPAHAATTTVTGVDIAGDGPGDLVRGKGDGFTPGTAVAVTLDTASSSAALTTVTPDSRGKVSLPAGTRIPVDTAPGVHRLTMTQPGGVAASAAVTVRAPYVHFPSKLVPGQPVTSVYTSGAIWLAGLASTPDVVRTVTIDGTPVATRWFDDENAFSYPDIGFDVPLDLPVGEHAVTFTQTGATPYEASGVVNVIPPSVSVTGSFAQTGYLDVQVSNTGWLDDFDATVVGAAGDRHTARLVGGSNSDLVRDRIEGQRFSIGTATLTVVSRHNGATRSTTFVVDGPTMTAPGVLGPGRRLVDVDGRTEVRMQTDGNLVLRGGRDVLWSSRTAGHPGARLQLQTDGNAVIRAADGRALWTTGTAGVGTGARFGLDALGSPTLVTAGGRTAWSSFAAGGQLQPHLSAGGYLFKGQTVFEDLPQHVTLTFGPQTDGNLVARAGRFGVLWQTQTAGHPNAYLTLQSDGNLVLRAPNGAVLWANGVRGTPGARLVGRSDGNVVEYARDGRVVWSTNTGVS